MSDGFVDKVTGGLTRVDHEPIGKLHRFGTGGAQLARDDDFATLCARLHNKTEDTIRRTISTKSRDRSQPQPQPWGGAPTNGANVPTDGEPAEELVTQRFTLCYGGETAVLDLFGVEFERALGELEPLLNEGRELANTPSLLS